MTRQVLILPGHSNLFTFDPDLDEGLGAAAFDVLAENEIPVPDSEGVMRPIVSDVSANEAKLATIETGADVTDATNVNAAGAVMHSDLSGDGVLVKTASETYTMRKLNLSASAAPTVDDDVDAGYAVFSFWLDITADEAYVCLDATDGAAVWKRITFVV